MANRNKANAAYDGASLGCYHKRAEEYRRRAQERLELARKIPLKGIAP
jgi:hypothetical protein